MCCSLVCNAILKALFPWESTDTPIILPGITLLNSSFVAKYAACGPPYPIGIPNRCVVPIAQSAPNSPGGVKIVKLKISAATTLKIFNSSAFENNLL